MSLSLALGIALLFIGGIWLFAVQMRFFSIAVLLFGLRTQEPNASRARLLQLYDVIQQDNIPSQDADAAQLLTAEYAQSLKYLTIGRRLSKITMLIFGLGLAALIFARRMEL